MYLLQILLPVYNNHATAFPAAVFLEVKAELQEQFTGVTFYKRFGTGDLWNESESEKKEDSVIMVELIIETVHVDWWNNYKAVLEKRFEDKPIIIRQFALSVIYG